MLVAIGDQVAAVPVDHSLRNHQYYLEVLRYHPLEAVAGQALPAWDMEAVVEASTVQAAVTDLITTSLGVAL